MGISRGFFLFRRGRWLLVAALTSFSSDRFAESHHRVKTSLALTYPYFLTCLGFAILANLISQAIVGDLDRLTFQVMAMVGMTLFYVGKQIPYYMRFPLVRKYVWTNSSFVLALTFAALWLPANHWIIVGVTGALLVYIALNYFSALKHLKAAAVVE